jgi:hypothetical protein
MTIPHNFYTERLKRLLLQAAAHLPDVVVNYKLIDIPNNPSPPHEFTISAGADHLKATLTFNTSAVVLRSMSHRNHLVAVIIDTLNNQFQANLEGWMNLTTATF